MLILENKLIEFKKNYWKKSRTCLGITPDLKEKCIHIKKNLFSILYIFRSGISKLKIDFSAPSKNKITDFLNLLCQNFTKWLIKFEIENEFNLFYNFVVGTT